MRTSLLLTAALLAACVHLPGAARAAPPGLSVGHDGRTATAGGETWAAPEGIAFFQRGDVLHVVSSTPWRSWDVAVPLGPDGKLAWPAEAPFRAAHGTLHLRAAEATPEVEELVASGQLHPHDDHYHLTHRLANDDWQALYRLRAEGSPLPPIRRQVAATILALLLDERIPGSNPDATARGLARMASVIGKARRAVEAGVGARALEAIITHDFEIRDDGRTLELGGKSFRAAAPLRFAYCGQHLHVEEAGGKWAQPVELAGQAEGGFAWPDSMFFVVGDDGTVKARGGQARWRKLVDDGQIHFARDHWHLTEKYANPRLQRILQAVADPKVAEPPRDRARALALELLRLRLDVTSEAEFDARLRAVDEVIDAAGAALEKELRVR
jgi:hypothetical protein